MKKYTTEDFQKAQFARADDGLLAIRAFPGESKPWLFVTKRGIVAGRPDSSMAREDWEPVTPTQQLTRSEFYGAREAFTRRGEAPSRIALEDFAHRLGVTVVPDREPTNAEKLAKEIVTSFNHCEFDFEASFEQLAKALDARGIKAPGVGNDEH